MLTTLPRDILERICDISKTENETGNDILEDMKNVILSDFKTHNLIMYNIDYVKHLQRNVPIGSQNMIDMNQKFFAEHNRGKIIVNKKIDSLTNEQKNKILRDYGFKQAIQLWRYSHNYKCKTRDITGIKTGSPKKCTCLDDDNYDIESDLVDTIVKNYIGFDQYWMFRKY